MTAEDFYIHDQETISSSECSTTSARGIEWHYGTTNEIAFSKEEMIMFAEAYHKAKVESISKEDIYSEICQFVRDMDSLTRQPLITHRKVSQRSVNWFKQQLLK